MKIVIDKPMDKPGLYELRIDQVEGDSIFATVVGLNETEVEVDAGDEAEAESEEAERQRKLIELRRETISQLHVALKDGHWRCLEQLSGTLVTVEKLLGRYL